MMALVVKCTRKTAFPYSIMAAGKKGEIGMPWPLHIVTVAGLVEDGKGNVLLTKSALRKEWEPCGGLVEPGENLEEALLREIREESGVKATVRCLTGIY